MIFSTEKWKRNLVWMLTIFVLFISTCFSAVAKTWDLQKKNKWSQTGQTNNNNDGSSSSICTNQSFQHTMTAEPKNGNGFILCQMKTSFIFLSWNIHTHWRFEMIVDQTRVRGSQEKERERERPITMFLD